MGYDSFYGSASTLLQACLKIYCEQNCFGLADNTWACIDNVI